MTFTQKVESGIQRLCLMGCIGGMGCTSVPDHILAEHCGITPQRVVLQIETLHKSPVRRMCGQSDPMPIFLELQAQGDEGLQSAPNTVNPWIWVTIMLSQFHVSDKNSPMLEPDVTWGQTCIC